jgi:hypothetical protein
MAQKDPPFRCHLIKELLGKTREWHWLVLSSEKHPRLEGGIIRLQHQIKTINTDGRTYALNI